jgi:hypothetical protein
MAVIANLTATFVLQKQGVMLDIGAIGNLAIAATVFCAGYCDLVAGVVGDDISLTTDVTTSEWAIIKPLFSLYVEREQGIMLEASRGLGVDVYGRTTSEIQMDIKQMEDEMPKKAFYHPIVSVGYPEP